MRKSKQMESFGSPLEPKSIMREPKRWMFTTLPQSTKHYYISVFSPFKIWHLFSRKCSKSCFQEKTFNKIVWNQRPGNVAQTFSFAEQHGLTHRQIHCDAFVKPKIPGFSQHILETLHFAQCLCYLCHVAMMSSSGQFPLWNSGRARTASRRTAIRGSCISWKSR